MNKNRSKILPVVFLGFTLILLSVGVSWFISKQLHNEISQEVLRSRDIANKMDLVASMSEIARTRTRLTIEMVYTDDIFERDEINLLLDSKASEFSILRQNLIALGLTDRESQILASQGEFIAAALADQRRAADLAMVMDDEKSREIAAEIVVQKVYPNQNIIIDHFRELLDYQKSEHDSLVATTQSKLEQYEQVELIYLITIFAGSIAIILFIAVAVHRIEKQLVLEKEKAQVTLGNIGDGVISVNQRGIIDYVNEAGTQIFGMPSAVIIKNPVTQFFDDKTYDGTTSLTDLMREALNEDDQQHQINGILVKLLNAPDKILKASISRIAGPDDQINGAVISFQDITESQALMDKIQFQASHDALTGLINRRAFEEKVQQLLKLYDSDSSHAFCIVDLDQFKVVNDSAGHAAGDELLKQLGSVMRPTVRRSDLLARLGGDEFGLFLPNVTPTQAITITEKLLNAIQSFGFYWKNNVYRVGASIGMVNVTSDFVDYEYLFQAADSACYVAKSKGRNQIHLLPIDAEILQQKSHEAEILQHMVKVLEQGEFVLFAQEIKPISLRTQGHRHLELLIRMRDADGSVIPPMSFIPLAERYGYMAKIDRWVLQTVCDHINGDPLDHTVFAINLSGQSLSSAESMRDMLDIIRKTNIPPGRLCLEITETVAISNLSIASQFMSDLQEIGCLIALDDFGSGLSSFSYLKTLPLDYLKIDGAFISTLVEDRASNIMVEAIHSVGTKMGLFTIAEYVENEETMQELQRIGIDLVQGYHIGKPEELIAPQPA